MLKGTAPGKGRQHPDMGAVPAGAVPSFLKHDKIDKVKWDNCISRSVNGHIYARSWYLNIVSPDWDALIEGDYEAVMPLTWKRKFENFR